MRSRIPLALLAALAAAAATAPAAQAAACGDSKQHGITGVVATSISCPSAVKVAQNYNYKLMGKSQNGWSCKGTRVSSTREKVVCRKASRRVTFRSTLTVELPTAPTQSVTNGGG